MTKTKKMPMEKRIGLILIGLVGSMCLIVYSFSLNSNELGFNFMGYDISVWVFAFLTILLGLIFATMLKSGLIGKWKLD